MSLVPYSYDLFDDLDRYFSSVWGGSRNLPNRPRAEKNGKQTNWMPAVDIKEEEDKYVVVADIPGVQMKDVDVSFENGVLSIQGHRESNKEEEKDGYKRVERVYGSFCREFVLPSTIDANLIKATGKDGVLTVEIPKQEKAKPVKIAVAH